MKTTTNTLQEHIFDKEVNNKISKLSKQQLQQIQQDTLYKLYLLQNYEIEMSMFKGSVLRWSSLNTYKTMIRNYTNNNITPAMLRYKNLFKYIQGLIDSGVLPFKLPKDFDKTKRKEITVNELIKQGILSNHQIKFIYDKVGISEEFPDTSRLFTRTFSERNNSNRVNADTCKIIQENTQLTNKNNQNYKLGWVFNPIKITKDYFVRNITKNFVKV